MPKFKPVLPTDLFGGDGQADGTDYFYILLQQLLIGDSDDLQQTNFKTTCLQAVHISHQHMYLEGMEFRWRGIKTIIIDCI